MSERLDRKRTLVYIMSPSYSGSTLLTRILSVYDQISTIGELKATGIDDIYRYQCSCGKRFLECEFWNELVSRAANKNVSLNLEDLHTRLESDSRVINAFMTPILRGPVLEGLRQLAFALHPSGRSDLNAQLERNAQIIEAICEMQKGKVFLDESKDPLRALYFARSGIWDFKVIQLVRDGRGTVNSDIKHNHRGLAEACSEWNMKIDEMSRFREMVSTELIRVSYEALCTEPEQIIAKILDFSGISDSQVLNAEEQRTQHIIGNDMRLQPMRELKLDEKWRSDLTPDELQVFYSLSGERNSKLGYKK